MAERVRLIAGAMSGTSADGVDVALVRVGGSGLEMTAELVLHRHEAYEAALKETIFAMRGDGKVSLAELARVGREISLVYARCVNAAMQVANLKADDLVGIAAHGQTLFHQPPDTIQWLDPALIARETGCAVISDFRRADCAAGGQGAPLVPFADYVLFRHQRENRIMLNLGGIANITVIPAGATLDHVIGFDTGPANCLSDYAMRTYQSGGRGYDSDGELAAEGCLVEIIADMVLDDPYFIQPPPKSLDIPYMIRVFERGVERARDQGIRHGLSDLLHMACWIAAESVARAVARWGRRTAEIICSGGGLNNSTLMQLLNQRLQAHSQSLIRMTSIKEYGIQSQAKEAMAFALLGAATLDNFPSNVPSCTGAKRAVVLGSITPKPYNSPQ